MAIWPPAKGTLTVKDITWSSDPPPRPTFVDDVTLDAEQVVAQHQDLVDQLADTREALRQVSALVADLAYENYLLRAIADRALRHPYQKKTRKDDDYDRVVDQYRHLREQVLQAGSRREPGAA